MSLIITAVGRTCVLMEVIVGANTLARSVTRASASKSCLFSTTSGTGAAAGADNTETKELARARTEKSEVLIMTRGSTRIF